MNDHTFTGEHGLTETTHDETSPDTDVTPVPEGGYDTQKAALRPSEAMPAPETTPTTTDPVITAAVAWAQAERVAPTLVGQLQKRLNVAPSGAYDEATAIAVRDYQKKIGSKKPDACAGEGTCRALGLVFHRSVDQGAVTKDTWQSIKERHGAGITIVAATYYANQHGDNHEFLNEAGKLAPQYAAVAIQSGRIQLGKYVEVRATGDIVSAVQGIHASLLSAWRAYESPVAGAAPPACVFVKNLAICAHGVPTGLNVDAGGSYSKGLVGKHQRGATGNLESFVQAIGGALGSEVAIQLFACNAARNHDRPEESYDDWTKHGDVTGETSFAQELADTLAANGHEDASVFGHATRGHLRTNDAVRGFGKVARDSGLTTEGQKGGVHAVDLIFPAPVIAAEVERIYGPLTGKAKDTATALVAQRAWQYYRFTWLEQKAGASERLVDEGITGSGLGGLGMIDLVRARDVVVPHDFAQWVAENIASFKSAGQVTEAARQGTPRDGSKPLVIPQKLKPEPDPKKVPNGDPKPTKKDIQQAKDDIDPKLVTESRGDVVAVAEKVAADKPKYGTAAGQLVCTTFCQKVLDDAGYTIDKAAAGRINVHGVGADELGSAIGTDDARIKGIVTALVDSKQGLEVPVERSAPAKHLRPGDFVQYWWSNNTGHCVMVHEVTDDQHIVMLSAHQSMGTTGDMPMNLAAGKMAKVYAVRPMGSADFALLVELRQSLGLPIAPFASGGGKVVPRGDKPEAPKKSHVDKQAELEQQHVAAIDPSAGKTPEEKAKKASWDAEVKAYRAALVDDAEARADARRAPLDGLDQLGKAQQEKRRAEDEADVKAEVLDPLDQKKLVIGREKKKAKLTERLTHLGLIGHSGAPVVLSASDRQLVLQRVDALANRLYFADGDEELSQADLDAMGIDLAQRMLSGRLAQRFLDDLAAYWSHFDQQKLSKKEARALEESDPSAHAAYLQDRKVTKEVEQKHGKLAALGRDITQLVGGSPKDPGASPDDVQAMIAAGRSGHALLEPYVLTQAARPAAEADPLVGGLTVSRRVDQVHDRATLDDTLQVPLARLGLGALPLSPADAPEVETEPAANEAVKTESLQRAPIAPPETKPAAYLTVVYQKLMELVLGVHVEPSFDSARLDDLRVGDRVPVTSERKESSGHVWAQAIVEPPVATRLDDPSPRLGWVDTRFTNATRDAGDTPGALSVIDLLKPLGAEPIPCFGGVYPEDRARPVGFVNTTSLELVEQTADNDPQLLEVLLDDRPVYVARERLRVATREERLLQQPSLSVGEIQAIRQYASCVSDADERAAIFERLQAQPMLQEAQDASVLDASRRGPLAALGMALESLGLAIPYAQAKTYADALEMVRLERGLPADVAQLPTLVGPFGATARSVDATQLRDAMRSGQAVLVVRGAAVMRLARLADDRIELDDPTAAARVTLTQADLAAATSWALSVPASYDAQTDDKADPGLRVEQDVQAAFKQKVYGATDQANARWYLDQAKRVHGAGVVKELSSWLPSGQEAAAMPPAAQHKAFDAWLAKLNGGLDGLAQLHASFVGPLGAAGAEVTSMRAELARRARAIIRPALAREATKANYDQALGLIAKAEALGLIDETEAAGLRAEAKRLEPKPVEPSDEDFARLTRAPDDPKLDPRHDPKRGAPIPLPTATAGLDPSQVEIGKPVYAPDPPTWELGKQRVTVAINNVTVTFRYTVMSQSQDPKSMHLGLGGWVTHHIAIDGQTATQDGEDPATKSKRTAMHLGTEDLLALGFSPEEVDRYNSVAKGESNSHGNMTVNAWDAMYVTMGAQGLISMNQGWQSDVLAKTLGPVLHAPDSADLRALLLGAGIEVAHMSGENYAFRARDKNGKWYDNQQIYTAKDVEDLYTLYGQGKAADRVSSHPLADTNQGKLQRLAHTVPTLSKYQAGGNNMAQLCMRLDPMKLAVMSALGSDPRMQAAMAMQAKYANEKNQTEKLEQRRSAAFAYLWSEKARFFYVSACNGGGSKGAQWLNAAIDKVAATLNKNLDDPGAWDAEVEADVVEAFIGIARKGNGETFVAYYKAHPDAIAKLSAERPTKRPPNPPSTAMSADAIARTFKPGTPKTVPTLDPKQAVIEDEKEDDKKEPVAVDVGKYLAWSQDTAKKAQLDAVHASAAGKRNLDAAVARALSELGPIAKTFVDLSLSYPSWTDRTVGMLHGCSVMGEPTIAAALARVLDVAAEVAAKYPHLTEKKAEPSKTKTDPNVGPGPGDAGGADFASANAYVQDTWFGADGKKLDQASIDAIYDAVEAVAPGVLVRTGNKVEAAFVAGYSDAALALDGFLQLSPAARAKVPETAPKSGRIYTDARRKIEIERTAAIVSVPAIKFMPGQKSCQRAARATLHDYGLEKGDAMTFVESDREAEIGVKLGSRDATRITRVRLDKLQKVYDFFESEVAKHPLVVGINYVEYSHEVTNQDAVTDHFVTAIGRTTGGVGYIDPGSSRDPRRVFVKQPYKVEVVEKEGAEPVERTIPMWVDPTYKGVGAQLTQVFTSKVVDPALLAQTTGHADPKTTPTTKTTTDTHRTTTNDTKKTSGGLPTSGSVLNDSRDHKGGTGGKESDIAKKLRADYASGVLLSLSIPMAFNSGADASAMAKTPADLDPYAFDVTLPTWLKGDGLAVAETYWAAYRLANPKDTEKLPATIAAADAKTQSKLVGILMGKHKNELKQAIFDDAAGRAKVCEIAFTNNRYITREAEDFAQSQGAVAADGAQVAFGRSMLYHAPGDIAPRVNNTSAQVRELLRREPATDAKPDQASRDERTAKVRFLALNTHGSKHGVHGRGRAAGARLHDEDVPGIIGAMKDALTTDVRVRLFACSTAGKAEGGFADEVRDALAAVGKTGGSVIGHTTTGTVQTNPLTRFFPTADPTKSEDWRAKDHVFDTKWLATWLTELGVSATSANLELVQAHAIEFFGRESWLVDDVETLDGFRMAVRNRWSTRYPDKVALKKRVKVA